MLHNQPHVHNVYIVSRNKNTDQSWVEYHVMPLSQSDLCMWDMDCCAGFQVRSVCGYRLHPVNKVQDFDLIDSAALLISTLACSGCVGAADLWEIDVLAPLQAKGEAFILSSCVTRTFSSSSVCRLCAHDDRGWNPEEKGFPAAVPSSTGEILFRRFLGMSSLKGLLWETKFMLTWVNVKYQSQEQLENRPQNDLLGAEKLINNVRKSFRPPVW